MPFSAFFVGNLLIEMYHKRDSLDIKCVHVSLKILDPGIQDVASLRPSSKGEDTQDKDVKGKIGRYSHTR